MSPLSLATARSPPFSSAMAPAANQQQPFPAVPPSLSAGDHEMRDYYAPLNSSRPVISQISYHKPYLGLRARLSQILINRWTILLFLVLARLLIAIASTNDSLASAQREANSACTKVENIGSSLASMPHFMAQGVNEMTATGVEKAVNGLMTMMELSVTGVEEIVLFVIHMMTNTYLCLITLAVRGSLGAAVEIGTEISKGLNKTLDEVTNGIGDATKKVTDAINDVFDNIPSLPFTPGFERPNINLTAEIDKLKGLQVPPELQNGLQKLNNSIPTFQDVQNFTDNVIRLPFEEVKKLIRGMNNFTFDRQLLPVPQKEALNFCSEGNSINDFFDDLAKLTVKAKQIGLAVLIVAAILVMVPMAYAEYRRWRYMEERVQLLQHGHDGMDIVYLCSRPYSASIGLWLGQRFGSQRRQNIVRWAWAYATSVPMLLLLSLGLAGLLSCFCQYLLVKAFEDKVPELTDQVANFAEKVVTKLNAASMDWSSGVNGAITNMDNKINDDVLNWVNTTTSAVNGTLNVFVDKMSSTLNGTFGGTILYEPIKDVLNCLIGLKIASFQEGLTWVHDHAHVNFPTVANNTFSLGALAQRSDSGSAAELLADPSGKTSDEITELVGKVVRKLISGIIKELIISSVIVAIWLVFAIGGLIYACLQLSRRDNSYDPNDTYLVNRAADGNAEKPRDYPDTAAPPYEYPVNKAAPYTLQPRPFQTYSPYVSQLGAENEKVGQVDAHPVANSARPGHRHESSHGHLADPSPIDGPYDSFASTRDQKRNPFAD